MGSDPTFVSLYSGSGGLDLGFARAGFSPVWSNDIDEYAVETYNRISKVEDVEWRAAAERFEGHQALAGDIRNLRSEIRQGIADVVVGGPPCQGFSVAGRMNPNDPRSRHVFDFLGAVAVIKPRAFVMENVAALARSRRWTDTLDHLIETAGRHFRVQLVILNAADWGVPQSRERMFLIGLPRDKEELALGSGPTTKNHPTVRSAIEQLPPAGTPGNAGLCAAKVTLARNPVKRKSPFAGMLFNGQGRPMDLDRPAPTLPASMGGNRTPVIDQDQLETGKEPWVVGYHRRVVIEGKAPLSSLPAQARLRRLTLEEAAAIQTFPRDMDWQGPQSAVFRQIGNAVPPRLAWAVALSVKESLS